MWIECDYCLLRRFCLFICHIFLQNNIKIQFKFNSRELWRLLYLQRWIFEQRITHWTNSYHEEKYCRKQTKKKARIESNKKGYNEQIISRISQLPQCLCAYQPLFVCAALFKIYYTLCIYMIHINDIGGWIYSYIYIQWSEHIGTH